jgi:hypothetical protein
VAAIARDHDVVGLKVSMNNPGSVSSCQSLSRVLQKPQQLSHFGLLLMDLLAEGYSLHFAHSALADLRADFIAAYFRAGGDAHSEFLTESYMVDY